MISIVRVGSGLINGNKFEPEISGVKKLIIIKKIDDNYGAEEMDNEFVDLDDIEDEIPEEVDEIDDEEAEFNHDEIDDELDDEELDDEELSSDEIDAIIKKEGLDAYF